MVKETDLQYANNILLPVSRGRGYRNAFRMAHSLVREGRGKIYAIYVIEVELALSLDAEIEEETSRGEEALSYIEELAKEEKCSLEAEILQARQAGPAIVQEAANIPASLIALEVEHRSAMMEFRVGRTTDYILRRSRCPVLLWRGGPGADSSGARGARE